LFSKLSNSRSISAVSLNPLLLGSDLVLGPIILTWYASKPENMERNRQFIKKTFEIEIKYPSAVDTSDELREAIIRKCEKENSANAE
jgi:hypothetical protein